jgi:flagellar hook-length control protein FliK
LIDDVLLKDAENVRGALERVAARMRGATTARLVQSDGQPRLETILDQARADLRAQLSQLREDPAMARFLADRGLTRGFMEAVDRVVQRLMGSEVQNMHGNANQSYHFFETPFPPGGPIESGQIHIFGDGGGKGRDGKPRGSVVLDLSTTRMGDLWVHLNMQGGRCACTFRTTIPEAAEHLRAESRGLVEALQKVGYSGATVQVSRWDGDRLRETAALMQRFAGLQVTG